MPLIFRMLIAIAAVLLIDLYFFQAVSLISRDTSPFKRMLIRNIYWGLSAYTIFIFLLSAIYPFQNWPTFARVYLFAIPVLLTVCKVAGSIFILLDDLLRFVRWIFNLMFISVQDSSRASGISRLKFLNVLAVLIASVPFVSLIYGMVRSVFDFKVRRSVINLPNLPSAFNGLKIVHISDIHIGSFISGEPLQKAVQLIKEQQPDVIFFTGDLVNNIASEVEPFESIFRQIQAPLGVYSTLGNHDYGDYVQWDSQELKRKNLETLMAKHKSFGWRLLMNEHVALERNGAEIAVLGVENWGAAMRFPKYGRLTEAHKGTERYPVKLLLSHDPSHWDAEIRKKYPDIDVTFSGHTHGMQFGIEIPGFKWSPSKYFYKQWADLYREGSQFIYVNRGLGFLGYPGRVGILPEITVIELHNGQPVIEPA